MTESTKQNLLNKLVVHYGVKENSQNYEICEYILDNGGISAMDGFQLGITQVHTRAHDLRRLGVPLRTMMLKGKKKKPYAMWYLDVDRIEAAV